MHKSVESENLLGIHGNNRTLYEILKIDSELLFLSQVGYDLLPFKSWTIEFMKDVLSKRKQVSSKILCGHWLVHNFDG